MNLDTSGLQCIDCGCTDDHACLDLSGRGCAWYSTLPPVCTLCATCRGVVIGIIQPLPSFEHVPVVDVFGVA